MLRWAALGGTVGFVLYLVLVLVHVSTDQAVPLVGPVARAISSDRLYAAFRLHDDDPRVTIPALIHAAIWGTLGSLGGAVLAAARRRRATP